MKLGLNQVQVVSEVDSSCSSIKIRVIHGLTEDVGKAVAEIVHNRLRFLDAVLELLNFGAALRNVVGISGRPRLLLRSKSGFLLDQPETKFKKFWWEK